MADMEETAALTPPGVYTTLVAGRDAVATNATFWAQDRAGVSLYRKTAATTEARVMTIGSDPGIRLSLVATPDAKIVNFATMAIGSTTLTARTAIFDASDIGKSVAVAGAGSAGEKLTSTIASVQSATQVTLANPAGTATDGRGATLGTNCGPAFAAALAALNAAGGGELIIDGLFFLSTPVVGSFNDNAAQVAIVGYGGDAGIVIACDRDKDALLLSGGGRLMVDGVNFIGTPLEIADARRALSFHSCRAMLRNTGWFGVACIGTDDGAVVYAEKTDLTTEDNFFGSCVGGLGNATIKLRKFMGFRSARDWFLDYGRFQSILFIKTGMSFTRAWIFAEDQFEKDSNAVGQSVFRVTDTRCDEGCLYAIAATTRSGTGNRIKHVEITGLQANNSFGGNAIYLERVDHAVIDQPTIGWRNTPGDGLVLNDCGSVTVRGASITTGAPGAPTGMADGILATDVRSLILEDGNFARFTFTRVDRFQQVSLGQGGVAPYQKGGRITDADFKVPPPVGTIGIDTANKRIYGRFAQGWLATPIMTANDDPTFALRNITPNAGALTGFTKYTKTSGGNVWGEATANLSQTMRGSFRLRMRFPNAAPGNYVAAGASPASFGANVGINNAGVRLGLLQNNGTQMYATANGNVITAPFPYVAGQVVQLDYNAAAGTFQMTINDLVVVSPTAVPATVTPDLEQRFSSSIYNVGGTFELLEYSPI
ncbi:hypothetical protein U1707_17725 [Sphingomonas sp. PB2P12]|uniref:hypothetical protein n=1 Tax=Sphingomonas sandaracina TaxID=3096157 RepID=UPI002FC8F061